MKETKRSSPVEVIVQPGTVAFNRGESTSLLVELQRPLALPFLKWAGGKQWLARIGHLFQRSLLTGTYYEPFLGGASLFFALKPPAAVLSDCNQELILTYRAVANEVESVISKLETFPHQREFYNTIRTKLPQLRHERAARFIYLNKAGWNGLYRVNRHGQFNVPFGSYKQVTICPAERLREAAELLQSACLKSCDFETATRTARRGDFVYFDPPYITTHNNNGFLKYNARLFSWKDQLRLAKVALALSKKGVHVMVSNADHKPILDLYASFYSHRIHRNSLIGGDVASRGRAVEVLLSSFPIQFPRRQSNGCP